MNLLFVIDSLGSGGAQRQMVNLALGLKQKGHQIEFFLYYPKINHFQSLLLGSGIEIYSYEKQCRFSIKVIFELRKRMINGNYDLVLSFLRTPNIYSELAHFRIENLPLIISERSVYINNDIPIGEKIKLIGHFMVDHITVNSYTQKQFIVKKFPWIREKISTIYNGIDLSEFTPKRDARVGKKLILLVIGSVVPNKNPNNLILALFKYRELFSKNIKIIWVGKITTDQKSQKTFRDAVLLIEELDLREHWEWLGERKDIPELLQQCDALIHPSFYEGLPNAICEALACGRPVLASNVCDHPLLIKEGWNGFLFDPHSPDEIAESIHKFSSLSQENYEVMCENARNYAVENLSLERYVSEYESLFQSLVSKTQ